MIHVELFIKDYSVDELLMLRKELLENLDKILPANVKDKILFSCLLWENP